MQMQELERVVVDLLLPYRDPIRVYVYLLDPCLLSHQASSRVVLAAISS